MTDKAVAPQLDLRRHALNLLVAYGILPVILAVFYVVFALIEPRFHSFDNFINIITQSSYLIILSTGQMVVLLTRGFDLSIGTVISLISVSSALVMMGVLARNPDAIGFAIFLACLTGLGIGLAVGAVNGLCVSVLQVSPFVVTLGMHGIALGFASTLSEGFPVFNLPVELTNFFSRGTVLGIPATVIVCIIVLAGVYLLLNHTVFGRALYVIGGNPRAAHVAGFSSRLHLTGAYVVCSFIAAIGALLLTARTGSGEPNLGGGLGGGLAGGLMLASIASAVIGGVSLRGGEGRIFHCVFGGLFVTILSIGMNLIRVDSYIQLMVLGTVLVLALFVDRLRSQIRL